MGAAGATRTERGWPHAIRLASSAMAMEALNIDGRLSAGLNEGLLHTENLKIWVGEKLMLAGNAVQMQALSAFSRSGKVCTA